MSRTTTIHPVSNRSATSSSDWDSIRHELRRIENELEAKLLSLSKISSNYLSVGSSKETVGISSVDALSIEIEKLLENLSDLNQRLTENLVNLSKNATNINGLNHTSQRHNEICRDYRREFERIRTNLTQLSARRTFASNQRRSIELNDRRQESFSKQLEKLIESKSELNSRKIFLRFPFFTIFYQKYLLKKRQRTMVVGAVLLFCLLFILVFLLN